MIEGNFFGVRVKTWLSLTLAGAFASLAVMPYLSTLMGETLDWTIGLIASVFVQSAILLGLIVLLGLKLSKKMGLRATPVIEGETKLSNIYWQAIAVGLLVGVIIVLLGIFLPLELTEGASEGQAVPPPWQGFLASFYGGIVEELQLRLLMVPLIAFVVVGLTKLLGKKRDWVAGDKIMWVSIFLAAILFGLGHLPATARLATITLYVAFRAVVLNGVGGVFFGWLFWKRGLESAMISHFSADIALHVILPLF